MQDLSKDWPGIPAKSPGIAMTESVSQKLTWLARRMGEYESPDELAKRLFDGEIVQFENAQERVEATKLAYEMALERAVTLAKRKGVEVKAENAVVIDESEDLGMEIVDEDDDDDAQKPSVEQMEMFLEDAGVEPEDIRFSPIGPAEKKAVVDSWVKGEYAPLEKQKLPFLDQVAKTLRNNETYQTSESARFMAKVQSLIPGIQTQNMTKVEQRK